MEDRDVFFWPKPSHMDVVGLSFRPDFTSARALSFPWQQGNAEAYCSAVGHGAYRGGGGMPALWITVVYDVGVSLRDLD